MTRYTEIHNHSVNAVFNPSHNFTATSCFLKKVSYSGEGIMKKTKQNPTFDWLDLKMLESFVSVLPCDWFTLSGWPRFQ